jgi:hypothetical protein
MVRGTHQVKANLVHEVTTIVQIEVVVEMTNFHLMVEIHLVVATHLAVVAHLVEEVEEKVVEVAVEVELVEFALVFA